MSLSVTFQQSRKNEAKNASRSPITIDGLSQAQNTGLLDLSSRAPSSTAPFIFTRTMMSSANGPTLFEIGQGKFDPIVITRTILGEAKRLDVDSHELVGDLVSYLRSWGVNPDFYRSIIAIFTGTGGKGVSPERVTPSTVTQIKKQVGKANPAKYDIFSDVMADYICSQLAKFGWIAPSYTTVYEQAADTLFPSYSDMLDAVAAVELKTVLDGMADPTMMSIEAHMKANPKQSISLALIAQSLANGVATGLNRVKGMFSPIDMVDSTLYLLQQVWTPDLNASAKMPASILQSEVVSNLSTNLAMFLIFQERMALSNTIDTSFSPDLLRSDVLPLISNAIAELMPHKPRLLSEVTDHLTLSSVHDFQGNPRLSILNEDISFSNQITAFTRTALDAKEKERLLTTDTSISEQLSSSLAPVMAQFSISKMVNKTIHTQTVLNADKKVAQGTAELQLILPSFMATRAAEAVSFGDLAAFAKNYSPLSLKYRYALVRDEVVAENLNIKDYDAEASKEALKEEMANDKNTVQMIKILRDHYKYLMHVSVAKTGDVTINAYDGDLIQKQLALTFNIPTDLVQPVGPAAIRGGLVMVREPVEAIMYSRDFLASKKLTPKGYDIVPFENKAVHGWNWHTASKKLSYSDTYSTKVRGVEYSVHIEERQMLGLAMSRKNLRFFSTPLAEASVQMWMSSILEQIERYNREAKASKDTVKKAAFEGHAIAYHTQLAAQLISLGNTPIGQKAASHILTSIQAEMYDLGAIDDWSHMHIGVQKTLLDFFLGAQVLVLLDLVPVSDMIDVTKMLIKSGVLAHIVSQSVDA